MIKIYWNVITGYEFIIIEKPLEVKSKKHKRKKSNNKNSFAIYNSSKVVFANKHYNSKKNYCNKLKDILDTKQIS